MVENEHLELGSKRRGVCRVSWLSDVAFSILHAHPDACLFVVGFMGIVIQLQVNTIRKVVKMRNGERFKLKKDRPIPIIVPEKK